MIYNLVNPMDFLQWCRTGMRQLQRKSKDVAKLQSTPQVYAFDVWIFHLFVCFVQRLLTGGHIKWFDHLFFFLAMQ